MNGSSNGEGQARPGATERRDPPMDLRAPAELAPRRWCAWSGSPNCCPACSIPHWCCIQKIPAETGQVHVVTLLQTRGRQPTVRILRGSEGVLASSILLVLAKQFRGDPRSCLGLA